MLAQTHEVGAVLQRCHKAGPWWQNSSSRAFFLAAVAASSMCLPVPLTGRGLGQLTGCGMWFWFFCSFFAFNPRNVSVLSCSSLQLWSNVELQCYITITNFLA